MGLAFPPPRTTFPGIESLLQRSSHDHDTDDDDDDPQAGQEADVLDVSDHHY